MSELEAVKESTLPVIVRVREALGSAAAELAELPPFVLVVIRSKGGSSASSAAALRGAHSFSGESNGNN
jgi:hypothetical protein